MSTGIGQGVAIPHAKLKGLKKFALSISRSGGSIDYGALDGQPVQILALLLSPEDQTKEHVRMIAEITKRLKFSHVRQGILDAKSAAEISKAFLKA
jgi:mannitol/fructose-specific phosphotransferase system IIA component (Ntr-type)